ncbi:MAG: prephenate dehydrogenase [Ferruginibacter sp.]
MNITIIGLGLIGGSMALLLRGLPGVQRIIGVDHENAHGKQALNGGLVDEMMDLEDAISVCDVIILAIPVDAIKNILPTILNIVDTQVIMDVGSTKAVICKTVQDHRNRGLFVASHPMWGTEFSGPSAATKLAFAGKAAVICDQVNSSHAAIGIVEKIYKFLGMHIVYMSSEEHDLHAAYVSHVSHITSFALANTVLEKEREDNNIFELASGGFESTVRLAKSHAEMWVPIFVQNRLNVLDVLNEHVEQLNKFKSCLVNEDFEELARLIAHANTIKRILK